MLGSLGLLEVQAGPRCRRVVSALRRLDVPAAALPFYEEHATADPRHGKDWIDGALAPVVVDHPEWAPQILRGARWRAVVNRRFFDAMSTRFGSVEQRRVNERRMNESWCNFGPLRVGYDDSVLAPRPWTIVQSQHAAALLDGRPAGPLLELHCGAGHIGQAAAVWSRRSLVQVDDNPSACAWARRNAVANAVDADVRCVDLEELGSHDESFALVLADPPYVPSAETSRFDQDPTHAIDGGHDGLDGIRSSLPVAARLTRPGGAIVLQVRGPGQVDVLGEVAAAAGLDLDVLGMVAVAPDRAIALLTCR